MEKENEMRIFESEVFTKGYIPFGISRTSWDGEGSCEIHKHEFIEMVYVSDGKSVQRVDGVPYDVESGDVLLIGYNQTHSFYSEKKFHDCNFFVIFRHLIKFVFNIIFNSPLIYKFF